MRSVLRKIFVRLPPGMRRVGLLPVRLWTAWSYQRKPLRNIFPWLLKSREHTNFTYDLGNLNKKYLASFVAVLTGADTTEAMSYMQELEADVALSNHIHGLTVADPLEHAVADPDPKYGRRLGWYALVRITKPRMVVETGVDKGLGSCVLAAALKRNAQEGFPGHLFATDINPSAGYLFKAPYTDFGTILYGDSIECISALEEEIDLFIHDSNHNPEYERREYEAVSPKLSAQALILSDNAHACGVLHELAQASGRDFLFFQETPMNHWYPGGGIGAAFGHPERAPVRFNSR